MVITLKSSANGEVSDPAKLIGSKNKKRQRTRLVCLVYVGGIGDISIRLQIPNVLSRSYSLCSKVRCIIGDMLSRPREDSC